MDVAARVVHVLAAAVWVGGTVFLVAVAVPYARTAGPERRTEIASEIGRARSTLLVLARANGVLTLVVPIIGVLLAH